MRSADRSIGVICGGLGVLCLLEAYRLWTGWPGPGTMPLVIGLIFILQAALYLGSPSSRPIPILRAGRDKIATIALLAALFAAYVAVVPWLGFTLSTWVFATLVARSISSEPSWVKTGILMGALSLASHYVFNQLLGASLPVNAYGF